MTRLATVDAGLGANFHPTRQLSRLLPLALALSLAGCASFDGIGPSAQRMAPAALGAVAEPVAWPAADWWKQYRDPVLDRLIARALAGSPTLRVAADRAAAARAAAGVAESALWPRLDAGADSKRQRFSENAEMPPPYAGTVQNLSHGDLTASWELDFFGRNRAALDAALGRARAAEADTRAARVLLTTEVARRYFQLARLLAQKEVAGQTLVQRQAIRRLVASRVEAGIDSRVELRQAEGAIPETRRDLAALDERIDLTRHALAALTGQGPEAVADVAPVLDKLPLPAAPDRIPADLIGRRADLSAARWRVEAASRDVARAKAEFYPNIDLFALAGFSAIGLDNWFKVGSREVGVGAAIHLPIFDAGRLRANLRASSAEADAAVDSYNATLIEAVREVADQLTSRLAIERQTDEEQAARAAAEQAFDLALQRYRGGLGTYLTVLAAENNVLAQRRIAIDLKARRIDAGLLLVRALGGGFAETPLAPGA